MGGGSDPRRSAHRARAARVESEDIPRDQRVVFLCRLGVRSAMAMRAFRSAGWDAWHMGGGIAQWADEGLPMEPEGAVVAPH